MKGWVRLYRDFLSWGLYKDSPSKDVFIHILLNAAYKEFNLNGFIVRRGFWITSVRQIATETGLSVQQVRTALEKLEATQAITRTATHRATLIGVVNYDFYQGYDFSATQCSTNTSTQQSENPEKATQCSTQSLTQQATQSLTSESLENSGFLQDCDFSATQCSTQRATQKTTNYNNIRNIKNKEHIYLYKAEPAKFDVFREDLNGCKTFYDLYDSWERVQKDSDLDENEKAELWRIYRQRAADITI